MNSTYNVNAFVPGDTNLGALRTEIYANDAHVCSLSENAEDK